MFNKILQLFKPKKLSESELKWFKGANAFSKGLEYSQLRGKENNKMALACFDEAIECGFHDDGVYGQRAFVLSGLSFYLDSIEDFDKAIGLSSSDPHLYYGRGNSKQCVGDFEGAIIDLEKAVSLSKIDNSRNRELNIRAKKLGAGWTSATHIYEFYLAAAENEFNYIKSRSYNSISIEIIKKNNLKRRNPN